MTRATADRGRRRFLSGLGALAFIAAVPMAAGARPADPLPSWTAGATRTAIVDFVQRTTSKGDAFVPVAERIATFDNDGTLWAEQPLYFQFLFALDRIRALAPQHPEWKDQEPYKSALAGDVKALALGGEKALGEIVMATHAGMTNDEFRATVKQWLAQARHPTTGRRYDEMVYQPMLELLAYLRANDFKTFIVSGGDTEFMRAFAEHVYGIPPEQVIGSRMKLEYRLTGDTPALDRKPVMEFMDDGPGKPAAIGAIIGRRPLFAAGNSDGDLQMLQWTTLRPGPSMAIIVHHSDRAREWAYDRQSAVGRLDKALDEAPRRGWIVVDMAKDWKRIYPDAAASAANGAQPAPPPVAGGSPTLSISRSRK
ncbi:HAD family hydrolase [Edaphosphingomonas haloaromaticamans]|uniref:Haloacid dehalogenase-like hydrolase n=1 Tax=Edaphosphingomonas haloaromaticamans TaxID=653954 RepID=A0A1S1HBG8_9SPHN|nr:HAD family hydrolase [Sphingomonas haloaromaticamans]OHT18653.1 haloacid dehalogenase-like hydrolase [Sphingomonas haloaromaticamans]